MLTTDGPDRLGHLDECVLQGPEDTAPVLCARGTARRARKQKRIAAVRTRPASHACRLVLHSHSIPPEFLAAVALPESLNTHVTAVKHGRRQSPLRFLDPHTASAGQIGLLFVDYQTDRIACLHRH